jgi:hypothetical protein
MPNYRRAIIPRGCVFYRRERRQTRLVGQIAGLREASQGPENSSIRR